MQLTKDWQTVIILAKTAPTTIVTVTEWRHPMTASAARAWMLNKLHRKISGHDPRNIAHWRARQTAFKKYTEHYQTELDRDRADLALIRGQRLRVYNFRTKEFQARFGHLLATND
jgi:hypothetical protein